MRRLRASRASGDRFGGAVVADELRGGIDDQAVDLGDRALGDGIVGADRGDAALLVLDTAWQFAAGGEEVHDAPRIAASPARPRGRRNR